MSTVQRSPRVRVFEIIEGPGPGDIRPGATILLSLDICENASCCEALIERADPTESADEIHLSGRMSRGAFTGWYNTVERKGMVRLEWQ